MPLKVTLPEDLKIVEGLVPTVGGGAPLGTDYVSVKNLHKLWIIIHYNQGDADNQTWGVQRDISVAGAASVAVATVCEIWSNLDCGTSDLLVRRTAAINYASGAGATHKQVVFQVDPESLGLDANGVQYDCVRVITAGNVAATSYAEIMFVGLPRYAGPVAMQPSIIID